MPTRLMLGIPICIICKHKLICNAVGLWYSMGSMTAGKLASVINVFEAFWFVYIFLRIYLRLNGYCLNKCSFNFLFCVLICVLGLVLEYAVMV